MSDWM